MQAGVLRRTIFGGDASSTHRHRERTHSVVVQSDAVTAHSGEHQAGALRTLQLPFPQRLHYLRWQWHRTMSGFRFWVTDHAITVGALPDIQFALLEVDVRPAQSTQLRRPQAGKNRGQQQRPRFPRGGDDRLDLLAGWNVDANFELFLVA